MSSGGSALRLISISELPAALLLGRRRCSRAALSAGAGATVAAALPAPPAAGAAVGGAAPLFAAPPPPHALNPSAAMISSTAAIQGSRFLVRIPSSRKRSCETFRWTLGFCTRGYQAAHSDSMSGVQWREGFGCAADAQYRLGAAAMWRWEEMIFLLESTSAAGSVASASDQVRFDLQNRSGQPASAGLTSQCGRFNPAP